MTVIRWLGRLPLATIFGCFGALASAFAYLVLLPTCRSPGDFSVMYPLAPFALCALPALFGLWTDWARLYRAARSTIFWSGATLSAAIALATLGFWLSASSGSAFFLALGPISMVASMVVAIASARMLWWAATRGRSAWRVVVGDVRRDEADRLVVLAADGEVIELDRTAADLGDKRSIDIALGGSLAVLGRFERVIAGDPFRNEPRVLATRVAAAAPSVSALRTAHFARARRWAIYLAMLAVLSLGFGAAMAYGPGASPDCELGAPYGA